MHKKILSAMLAITLLFSFGVANLAVAETEPKPVSKLSPEEVPEPLEGQHHYLLLCVDQWTGKEDNLGNTDGMVLLTLDTKAQRIMLTSFSRDMLITRPDGKLGRVTYIAKNYGPEALCEVISEHFGVKVQKYLLFDMQQIGNIVDHFDGVDIELSSEETNYLKRKQVSATATTPKLGKAGKYTLNGYAAVIYMRIRKLAGGEFIRTQRVRSVLSALAGKCRELTFDQALDLLGVIAENTCLSNMSLSDMMEAMDIALKLKSIPVEEIQMPLNEAAHGITYVGMSVKEIDYQMCRDAMTEYLAHTTIKTASQE